MMAARSSVTENWRKHLVAYDVSGVPLFDTAFLDRWGSRIWKPEEADKRSAAELHTEISSRIATQPLGYLEGVEVAALESIVQLFGKARDAADKNFGANHFDLLAWYILNTFVRPFTAKWHPQSKSGALSALDTTDEFRAELAALQKILTVFDELLLDVRDGHRPPPVHPSASSETPIGLEMAKSLRWGISKTRSGLSADVANRINIAEKSAIEARRTTYSLPVDKSHAIGLALSGGGIRSATFSLGVMISLARRNLLPQFDYMSTVSGGGYLGSFLTTFLAASAKPGPQLDIGLGALQLPFRRQDGEAEALRHIRHRSKYLQTSVWERIKFAIAQTYGMLVNDLALAILPATFALIEYILRPSIDAVLSPLNLVGWIALGLLVSATIVVPIIVRFMRTARTHADGLLAIVAIALIAMLAWGTLGILHRWVEVFATWIKFDSRGLGVLALLGAIPLIASASIGLLGRKYPRSQRVLAIFAGLSVPCFFLGVELAVYYLLSGENITISTVAGSMPRWQVLLALIVVFGAIILLTLDINFTSPHRHYRRKLAQTFLIQPAAHLQADRPFDASVSLPLSRATDSHRGPYHLLNCALNVPGSHNPAMQGRLTDLFLFSSAYCGSPLIGYYPTQEWEHADADLDLGTAMAISGAAASPLMGLGTVRYLSFWMALLNVRLGYWVRKPTPRIPFFRDVPGIGFLLREMIGIIDERKRYLNVTDGGHVENLGVYELLRRRCKFIVAVDGEHDPSMIFYALTNLQRLAAIDLGVTIDIDLADLRLGEKGLSRSHFQFCRIRYPLEADEQPAIGYLLYLKLSLTGNEGEFLKRYQLDEPEFPHHSTANQFFTEVQFEAYRALGEHVGDKLFLQAIVGSLADSSTVVFEEWFTAIGNSMLRPV